ncbi:MAG: transglutaminase-like domain-containing protein [Nanoarchaeota archaeon]|nr:transglutaminase-like domain-containing protein [Nanoarchaeota archaeon]
MNFKKALGATLLAGAVVCATAIGGKPYKSNAAINHNSPSNNTYSSHTNSYDSKSPSYFVVGEDDSGAKIVKVNRGAFVSGKDPSLTGLVSKLTDSTDSKEAVAQKLLNYVSKLHYNSSDPTEKNALEVLSTGSADCRGKAVLYSSLLGNVGIDNVIVYFPTHLSVAVEGNHPNQNGLAFDLDGKRYSIAEPCTENGFEIGRTESSQLDFNKIEQIQRSDGKIFDVKTGKELPFY